MLSARGVIVVGGPNVAGRDRTADAIARVLRERGVTVDRQRWCRTPGRFALAAGALDVARWRRARRSWAARVGDGVVLVDGSWFDVILHEDGRGSAHIGALLALASLVPRADLVVIVDTVAERKRPGPTEPWRAWAWRALAPWIANDVAIVDAARGVTDTAVRPAGARWQRLPVGRRARDVRVAGGADAAAAVIVPHARDRMGRVSTRWKTIAVRRGWALPAAAPLDGLDELWHELGVAAEGVVALTLSAEWRRLVAVASRGRLTVVAKFGPRDDAGLRREAEVLERLSACRATFAPRLRHAGPIDDLFVVVTDAVTPATAVRTAVPDGLADICAALHRGDVLGRPLVHGDLAPWNLLHGPDGLMLVDWENARDGCEPMWDLTHFVVQRGAVEGRLDAAGAVRRLTAPGSPGWRYLEAIGADPRDASHHVSRYLRHLRHPGRFHREMAALVGQRLPPRFTSV